MLVAGAEPGGLAIGLSPNNAPRPRPKAGFAMRPECRRAGELSIQSAEEMQGMIRSALRSGLPYGLVEVLEIP